MPGRLQAGIFLAAWIGAVAASGADPARARGSARPRELSEAERAAVELAASYLQRGPEAWWQRLSADAPLRRLGRQAALEEIAVRTGPTEGAIWQLLTPGPSFDRRTAVFGVEFASGIDETLILHLVDEGGWKIAGLRTSVDASGAGPSLPVPSTGRAARAPASDAPEAAVLPASVIWAVLALLLGGSLAVLLLVRAGRRSLAIRIGGAVLVLGGGLCLGGLWFRSRAPAPSPPVPLSRKPAADPQPERLGTLAPLRAALAAGTDRAEIERRLAVPPRDGGLREVHDLWRAQYLLQEADLAGAGEILTSLPSPARRPLTELLRARLAFRRLRQEETGWSYEQAIRLGLDHDGVRMESVLGKALTNEGDLAEREVMRLIEMGSRMSEPWYAAAQVSAARGQTEEAENLLRRAWQLAPVPRSTLFGNPILAFLAVRPSLFPLFQFDVAEEARPVPEGDSWPLPLPEGASAASCGQSLRLTFGGAELLLPGGAQLAPLGTVLEDAGAWSRHAEARALAALPALMAGVRSGETPQPRLLHLAEQAGRVLAEQNRWSELLTLTEPLVARIERAPAGLVRLRAEALRRLDRKDEARQLLIRLAGTDFANHRPAPGTLLDLAELFAAAGEYDTAIKLSLKADSQLPEPRGERRRKQFAMERDLTDSFVSYRSKHFDVRYPKATGERYARGVAMVLEQERRRLGHWIPQSGDEPIEVHLFPMREFFENYGGEKGVVGIFDGKMRVPFAELKSLHPTLVAILSHELAHGMIAAATRDQAPHWFQEGLAEHIEMGMGRLNPLPDLARTGRVLSFPTIDPILRGFSEPQLIDLAYSEAAWTIQFIEARYGVKAIHRLLAAYGAGKTTEQAIADVCRLSLAEFDRALWQWGTTQAPQSRNLEVLRYDVAYDQMQQREQRQSVRSILRLGMSEEALEERARSREEAEQRRRRMVAWHASYAVQAAAVRRAFDPILRHWRGGGGDFVPACTELSAGTSKMLADPALLISPDDEVNRTLREVYERLADLAQACLSGRDSEIGFLIIEVRRALDEAARFLKPYGLSP